MLRNRERLYCTSSGRRRYGERMAEYILAKRQDVVTA
jgi:hypothetical protein